MQDGYGRDKKYTDYDAMDECLNKIYIYCSVGNYNIAIPYKIGCANAGGDWNIVLNKIKDKFEKSDIVCKIYRKEN